MRKHTTYTEEIEGVECEITYPLLDWMDVHKARIGDKLVIAYCVSDECYRDIDDLMGDCMGKLYSFHRHADKDDQREALEALGRDRDGEPDLDAVWNKHEGEAIDRYIKKVMTDRDDYEDIAADLAKSYDTDMCEPFTTQGFIRLALADDANAMSRWGNVWFYDTMQVVLEDMWEEPKYFPGDRDAVLLDCYEHGGVAWSITGGGTQCRWDTSRGAGVWVPDDCLRKELDTTAPGAAFAHVRNTDWMRGKGKSYQLVKVVWSDEKHNEVVHVAFSDDSSELHTQAKSIVEASPKPTPEQVRWGREQMVRIYCQQFLNQYNDIINGNVFGCVVETFDEDGKQIDEDACWGFIGTDDAEESLKSEFFDPVRKRLEDEVTV